MTEQQLLSVKAHVEQVIARATKQHGSLPSGGEGLFEFAAGLELTFSGYGDGPERLFGLARACELAAQALGEPLSNEGQTLIARRDMMELNTHSF